MCRRAVAMCHETPALLQAKRCYVAEQVSLCCRQPFIPENKPPKSFFARAGNFDTPNEIFKPITDRFILTLAACEHFIYKGLRGKISAPGEGRLLRAVFYIPTKSEAPLIARQGG